MARVTVDVKAAVPRRVRDVLDLETGDYVRVSIIEVIKMKQERKGRKGGKKTGLSSH